MTIVRRFLARRRLLDAERRFFDSYGRGGGQDPHALVVPIGYYARRDVAQALEDWVARGEHLDPEMLERAWRDEGGTGPATAFYRNLAHFVALVGPTRRRPALVAGVPADPSAHP